MARVFTAGVSGVVANGGACYWFLVIKPNSGDSWTKIAIGTLTAYSLAGYSVQAGRLLSIGDIDNKINVYGDPLALSPDVEFAVQNIALDFVPTAYVGREVELRFGSGETMTDLTSDVMFTGKIYGYKTPRIGEIVFTVRGISQLANKTVGERLPADVDEKYRGKIYPMTWGDYSGTDDFAPVVLNRAPNKLPDVVIDTEELYEFIALVVYDKDGSTFYRAKETGADFTVSADNSYVSLVTDISAVLNAGIGETDTKIKVTGTGLYDEYSEGNAAKPFVLKIGVELLFVFDCVKTDSLTHCSVKRGYMGTTPAAHSASSSVLICSDDISKLRILVSHIFYIEAFGSIRNTSFHWYDKRPITGTRDNVGTFSGAPVYLDLGGVDSGSIEEVFDDSSSTHGSFWAEQGTSQSFSTARGQINLVLPKIGIEGEVQGCYVIGKIDTYSVYDVPEDGLIFVNTGEEDLDPLFYGGRSCTSNGSTFLVLSGSYNMFYDGTIYTTGLVLRRTAGSTLPLVVLIFSVGNVTVVSAGYQYCSSIVDIIKDEDTTIPYTTTYKRLLSSNGSVSTVEDTDAFNNVDGSDNETDMELTGGLKPANISNLDGYCLTFVCTAQKYQGLAVAYLNIYRLGLRCDFYVSPLKYDFWARCKGRVDPGGGITGVVGELIENPANLIENFINTADNGGAIAECDNTGFSNSYTDRAAWKLAYSVYGKNSTLPKFRDEIQRMLACSGLICFEKYDGTLGLATLDAPDAVTRFITDDEITVDSALMADVDFGSIDTSILITAVEVKYKPVLPVDDKYAGVIYCNHTGSDISNFTDDINEYSGYLADAYGTLGEDRPYTVEAPCIRDAATAELLAKLIIKLRYKALEQITVRGSYSLLDIEIGDKIGTNSSLLASTGLNDKTYIVTGMRIQPNVNKVKPDVRLTLTELGTATITERPIWQDSASAPTNIKTDVASGGRVIMEV